MSDSAPLDPEKLRAAFAALTARVDYLERASGLFASDQEMQGPKGDPEVRFSPKAWRGAPQVGQSFSACDPDFLDVLAEALAWSADNPKPGKEKYASYSRMDARRARTWAKRIRAGWTPPAKPERGGVGRPGTAPRERPASAARPTSGRPERPGRPGRAGRPGEASGGSVGSGGQGPSAVTDPAPVTTSTPAGRPGEAGPERDVDQELRDPPPGGGDDDEDLFGPADDAGDLGDDFFQETGA